MVTYSNKVQMPIFIHSSFRTGSTWLWSKFRENKNCYCYYEVFNEILASIDYKSILQSPSTWNSHHPLGPPYFSEFSPLLKKIGGGVKFFDKEMSLSDFFLEPNGDPDRLFREETYLQSLVELSQNSGRIPVLSCTRSIGRIKFIKESVGGSHILIKRSLLNQWFSYSNQAANYNLFFLKTIIETIYSRFGDEFIYTLKTFCVCNEINVDTFNRDHDSLLIIFLALHIYLYAKYYNDFDLVIDLERDPWKGNLNGAARAIFDLTSIEVDLSDYNEVISAPCKLIADVDRVVILVRSLFAQGLPGVDDGRLQAFVDNELADFQKGYEQYRRIAGSAHVQLGKNATIYQQVEAQRDDANAKLAAFHETENNQISDMSARLEVMSDEVARLTQDLRNAERSEQHERAQVQSLSKQLAEAVEKLHKLEQDLEQTRSHGSQIERQLMESERVRTSGEDAQRALEARCSRLELEVQRAASDSSDAHAQHEAKVIELTAMERHVEALTTAIQQERTERQSLSHQIEQVANQTERLEKDLEQSRLNESRLEHQLMDSERVRTSGEDAQRALEARCSRLELEVQRVASDSIDAHAQHEAKVAELAAMARYVEALTTAIQQERTEHQSLTDEILQVNEQNRRLENEIEQGLANRRDLNHRLEAHEQARASAEKAMRATEERCANLDRDLQETRAEAEQMLAALEWVSSGDAQKSDVFARRWSAMMDRIR